MTLLRGSWGPRSRAGARALRGWRGRRVGRGGGAALGRVERFDRRPIEQNELLNIRIPVKFCQNSGIFSQFFRNSENVETSQHFLEYSAKSREKIIKIAANFDENHRKIMIFCENSNKNSKKFDEFLRVF